MNKNYGDEFAAALAEAKTAEEIKNLLMVIMAQPEYEAIAQRYRVLKMLQQGASYTEIVAETEAAAIMISRIDSTMAQNEYRMNMKNKEKYASFASVYDELMEDAEYEKRAEYTERIFDMMNVKPKLMLDLACGTGTMTKLFAEKGYDMIGVDLSVDMLDIAKSKSEGLNILYLNQPMEEFELYGTVDAVVCMLDSLNYVLDYEDVVKTFKLVKNYLNPGGVFVFDVNTNYKLEKVLAGNVFCGESDNAYYTWENYYDKEEKICEFKLEFFIKDGEKYSRHSETHYERGYSAAELKKAIKESGLTLEGVYDDMTFEPENRKSERLYFVCTAEKEV